MVIINEGELFRQNQNPGGDQHSSKLNLTFDIDDS